ncbi:hypothetical protein HYU93_01375 [Candidatus Daviesbacteria bacterium]|nr:hypothetical protein [Candidatus Daviesbacteria bacterium]
MRKFTVYSLQFTVYLLILLYPVTYNLFPAYAEVKIEDKFGFGDIPSLGEGTSKLVTPFFSIAAVLVIIYFLLGAFKYLKAAGNKEEVAGAQQMITHSIIGFVILIFAFFILQFLLSSLLGITVLRLF